MADSSDIRSTIEAIRADPEAAIDSWRKGGLPSALLRALIAAVDDLPTQHFLVGYPETPSRILE